MNAPSITAKEAAAFIPALRVNEALTASLEKCALQWMAARSPRWLTSDQLTLLGLSAQIGAGVGYALARTHRFALLMVVLCIALNWLGDSWTERLPGCAANSVLAMASTSTTWWTSSARLR